MSGNETPTRGHIQINNVSKIYDPDGAKVLAVDRCTMDIAPGEFCVVVGPSGCGKTTLLNAIAGFHSISSGEILLDGEVLCSADKQAQPGSDRIVVFQNGALFPWFTVLENVTFGPIVQKAMRKEEAEDKAMEMLGQMGLMGIENNYPSEISSGMRRRVEIARAMMNNPRVLLLDEPFRAMDALTKTVVHQFLLQVYDRSKTTVFFITHDLEEAIFLGSKVYIMTTRPATIKKILDGDIPRPRDFRVLSSPTYTRLKEECISAVHEEALKAFKAGEREMYPKETPCRRSKRACAAQPRGAASYPSSCSPSFGKSAPACTCLSSATSPRPRPSSAPWASSLPTPSTGSRGATA